MKGNILFSEEFMDDLAERVARKLANRFYRNGFFNDRQERYHSHTRRDYNNYDGGCGSSHSYEPNGSC